MTPYTPRSYSWKSLRRGRRRAATLFIVWYLAVSMALFVVVVWVMR